MAEKNQDNILTPKRTVKYFFINFAALSVASMIIWPLLDWLFSKIFNDAYEGWTVMNGIVTPVIFSLIFTIVEFVFWNLFHKEK